MIFSEISAVIVQASYDLDFCKIIFSSSTNISIGFFSTIPHVLLNHFRRTIALYVCNTTIVSTRLIALSNVKTVESLSRYCFRISPICFPVSR